MSTVATTHIKLDEMGVAWIDDTNVKVVEVVTDKLAYDSSPEEIYSQYPHLSMGQIHAALAYYYDHQTELDEEIQRRWKQANEISKSISDDSLREKLLGLKNKKTYRKRIGHDTWHFCSNCSNWPTKAESIEQTTKPTTGEFCNECRAKEMAGSCH
jgi:uncharacterized protein (DUF433 family)